MLAHEPDSGTLRLEAFVPFRLNRLADAVSVHLSEVYRDRFGLEIPEWRILVTVGQRRECTAQFVASSTRMHKTRVSRAVSSLEARSLIARTVKEADGREMSLQLTRQGRRMYEALVPLALRREAGLLSCLAPQERRAFLFALGRLEAALGLVHDE
jgi:DNA-binding MarR family transcriptional regulator